MYAFGPIPSRRLGQSLGINNIPPKHCTYSCVYCQVGRTDSLMIERREFYKPQHVFGAVESRIEQVQQRGGHIDYLSFVPDGEPTLDINLGEEINLLKSLGYKIAVFTNAALIWQEDVRNDLLLADQVSLKVDTICESNWREINRPYGRLRQELILQGIMEFVNEFTGTLTTETMLVSGLNDNLEILKYTADFISHLHPDISYISIPTRPPAENWVEIPSTDAINLAYQIFKSNLNSVEMLHTEVEENFGFTGNAEDDLLQTAAVQPLTERAIEELLANNHERWSLVHRLIAQKKLREVFFQGRRFYIRQFPKKGEYEESNLFN
ncbi:MAG: radical SAM protein [Aliifodinibius sp.]|nr:radical SAM protein [Fodinibius sp.]